MTNTNPKTGIAYGYISGNALDSDLLQILQDNGVDIHYDDARNEAEREHNEDWDQKYLTHMEVNGNDADFDRPEFDVDIWNDGYHDEEPVHAGTYQGVQYQTSWLGGALNVWIFESPHITEKARAASPCVPGAAILDTLDGSTQGYNVPDDWRHVQES